MEGLAQKLIMASSEGEDSEKTCAHARWSCHFQPWTRTRGGLTASGSSKALGFPGLRLVHKSRAIAEEFVKNLIYQGRYMTIYEEILGLGRLGIFDRLLDIQRMK